ncbi:MAG: tetratricopeptide repeat protein, partial [Candidatus Acidiferrales bacterium]
MLILILGVSVSLAIAFGQSGPPQKSDPSGQALAQYHQGILAIRNGDLAAAQSDFEKVLSLAPRSPEGQNSLGWVLLRQGQIDSAISHLRMAVQLKPDFPQAHINLANALGQKG